MFNTFIMYGIILFFAAAGILGHWLRDRDPTEKWFKFYMRNYNQMKRWFQLDPNGGFYILWKWHPWEFSVSDVQEFTDYCKKKGIWIKQYDVDVLKKHETRPEVLAIIETWDVIPAQESR